MPIYEYKCQECEHVFEDMVLSSRDTGPDKCPKCGAAQVSRLISGTNFQLKGGGWFHSDYGKKTAPVSNDSVAAAESGETSSSAALASTGGEKEAKTDTKEKVTPAPAAVGTEPSA